MKINIKKQSGIYTLTSEQILPISLEKAWEFFTHPNNLDRITPKEMQFEITNNPPDKTYLGQIITYKIGILPMIKSNWITEITHFEDRKATFWTLCNVASRTPFRSYRRWKSKNDGYCQFQITNGNIR